MVQDKKSLIDVGIKQLPFPMKVTSRDNPDGQDTAATISISARIVEEYEADWMDRFIEIIHQHRGEVGAQLLQSYIVDYLKELNAKAVRIDFEYPYFIEKLTPVSKKKCLVKCQCTYSAKTSSMADKPRITFKMDIPAITTDPSSDPGVAGGLFGQLTIVSIEVESSRDVFPEDLVELVDRHALSPVYSFLTPDDRIHIIQKVHSERKSSMALTDDIKEDLTQHRYVSWYAVRCANFGMLHSYSTLVGTESFWVPFRAGEGDEV